MIGSLSGQGPTDQATSTLVFGSPRVERQVQRKLQHELLGSESCREARMRTLHEATQGRNWSANITRGRKATCTLTSHVQSWKKTSRSVLSTMPKTLSRRHSSTGTKQRDAVVLGDPRRQTTSWSSGLCIFDGKIDLDWGQCMGCGCELRAPQWWTKGRRRLATSVDSPHLTLDRKFRMNASSSLPDPAFRLHPYDAAALRPQPAAGVFKKLGFGRKSSVAPTAAPKRQQQNGTILHAVSGDDAQIHLPLAEALAISPDDETLQAIKRAHAAAAANAQAFSHKRLTHKFSSALLDLAAGKAEPTVIGIWTSGEPQWIGEHRIDSPERVSPSSSRPASADKARSVPRLTIPEHPRGRRSPTPVLVQHNPTITTSHAPRPEFAEFGYVSPVSSSPSSPVHRRASLLFGPKATSDSLYFSSPSDNDSVYNKYASGESDGGASTPNSQEIHTPPQSSGFPLNRDSVAWSVKDPCAAGVFDEDSASLSRHPSLRPAGLAIRPTKSATPLNRRDTHAYAKTRASPRIEQQIWREEANRQKMAQMVARLKAAGVKQHKLDALVGLDKASDGSIPAKSANSVVIGILKKCNSMKDLFSLAVANKGFYTAFKSQELTLMKNALRNQSSAAWEHREMALDSLPFFEYTPSQYLAFHTRDVYVLAALKEMLCSSQHLARDKLRVETLEALKSRFSPRAIEIDDAFWRIWTFCELFGPEKGEEEDITAQMDWLRGGRDVQASRALMSPARPKSHGAASTRSPSAASRPTDVRASTSSSSSTATKTVKFRLPPAQFGLGNPGGLNNAQLEDLQEIWIGLKNLLSRISFGAERVEQAREHGVFDDRPPIMDEDECLEEWIYYLLGLGLSVVQDLAAKEPLSDASVFDTAKHMEWTDWEVLASGASRRTFLEEAVKRVSLDQCKEAQQLSPVERANTEAAAKCRRSRGQSLANELRQAKKSANLREVPYSEERPMSLWLHFQNQEGAQLPEPVVESPFEAESAKATIDFTDDSLPQIGGMVLSSEEVTPASARSFGHPAGPRRTKSGSLSLFPRQYGSPTLSPEHTDASRLHHLASSSRSSNNTSTSRDSSGSTNSSARSGSTQASSFASRGASPMREAVNEPHLMHPAFRREATTAVDEYNGRLTSPVQENSVDRFVFRIVEMGFTAEDARRALRKTDDGKCLSVDRAVEWLLSA
ncbi:hypothetical protein FH972_021414 [Carpinus fangiana]|uniref:UBA domain-containing protein n=1 Tax=Carpinus fangiana TaxID=176857 RepID=A0A5N6KPX0_9ROSI|nr:hypothetical protein FH972_021414 [Carpinus fangiana]